MTADQVSTVWNRYHDIMLAAKTNYSLSGRNFNTVFPHELRYQVTRNSHHPSIAMWDGCNECELMTPGSAGNRFAKMGMAVVRHSSYSSNQPNPQPPIKHRHIAIGLAGAG